MHEKDRSWEQMGAASGLLATLLFIVAFVILLGTSPGGSPRLPNIKYASFAPSFIATHLTAIRMTVMLTALGIALSLWFLGTLWVTLRETGAERGSSLVLVGGIGGALLQLAGLALLATIGLSTSANQANAAPVMYVAASLLIAFGGGVSSLFFFGVAKVSLHTEALPKWIGVLAFIEGMLCVLAFLTPFFATQVLNPATGALGRIAWSAGAVIWLFLASGWMTLQQLHEGRDEVRPAPMINQPATGGGVAR